MGFSWIGQLFVGRFDRWNDDRIILRCKSHISIDAGLVATAGCPGIVFTVTSKGKRPAKIKAVKVKLKGEGFLKALEAGFARPFGHVPMEQESLRQEELQVTCWGLDQPTCHHGWTIDRDDFVRFFYPAGMGISANFATALCDNLSVVAVGFDDDETEIVSGDKFQAELQPVLDECIKNNLRCKLQVQINVLVLSQTAPDFSAAGQINTRVISLPAGYPDPSAFVVEEHQVDNDQIDKADDAETSDDESDERKQSA